MRYRYYINKSFTGKIIFSLILIAILIIYIFFENQIKPEILDITKIKAEQLCNNAVNTAVLKVIEDENYKYGDFAEISSNSNKVINIGTNSVNANRLKSKVAIEAQKQIDDMDGMQISYKLGDFFGSALLSGRGPDIIIQLYFSSSIATDIKSDFESCGMNQTKHTLNIIVTSKVYITSDNDKYDTYTTVVTTVPIAENIIIGDIPTIYFNN